MFTGSSSLGSLISWSKEGSPKGSLERERNGRARMITVCKGGSGKEKDILFKEDPRAKACPGRDQ